MHEGFINSESNNHIEMQQIIVACMKSYDCFSWIAYRFIRMRECIYTTNISLAFGKLNAQQVEIILITILHLPSMRLRFKQL